MLVDETSDVLDMLEKEDKKIVEMAANDTGTESVDGREIRTKIQALTERMGSLSRTGHSIRLCKEFTEPDSVTPVSLSLVPLAVKLETDSDIEADLPDSNWKLYTLAALVEEWLELKAAGKEEEETGQTLAHYIHILCDKQM